jgi:hypothetical protein
MRRTGLVLHFQACQGSSIWCENPLSSRSASSLRLGALMARVQHDPTQLLRSCTISAGGTRGMKPTYQSYARLYSKSHASFKRSSRSSSSHPPFLLCTVTLSTSCCCSLTAFKMSFSCVSDTLPRSWPVRANMISLLSTSSARGALTSRIRPSLSAAAGSRICESMDARTSASRFLRNG